VTPQDLKTVERPVASLESTFNQFTNSHSKRQLNRAENYADGLLDVAKGLPSELPGKSSSYTKAANKAATELKALGKQINDSVSRTEKLTANSESVQQDLQSSVLANTANWDEQFSTKYGELSDKADSATELLQVVGAGALSQQYVNERSE
jgi:hypothetical protein